ncbi:hypothetical protein FHS43_002450 [Streptosporangium becharense]|uniref:Uncharacterized protein n=1 Tax=Streptosporangium becharense TaxID=1816182 RepID=A0A7W9MI28_9ACTN|nr:hypothetical protein [Streptosporangium becharense]MBB2911185.1 hypothetical protein [Streptosporangium becharense]MBB5821757.1 hypothetical protein [Streptosporangium becharense]
MFAFPAPRPSHRSPRPRAASRRRRAAAAVAALVLGTVPACTSGTPDTPGAGGAPDTAPAGNVHRLTIPPAQKAGSVRLDGMWPFLTREELMERRPHVPDLAVQNAVQIRYEEIKKAKGQDWTRNLIFTGYDVTIRADQQAPVVDRILDDFVEGEPDREFTVPTGSFGGHARCVGEEISLSETGMCVWADDGTVGVVLGAIFTAAELTKLLPGFRAAVERRP